MKRSSKQKALEVQATKVSKSEDALIVDAPSRRRKQSAKVISTKAVKPTRDAQDEIFADVDLDEENSHPSDGDEWEEAMTDAEDLWAEDLEVDGDETEVDGAIANGDYFEDEFVLNDEEDFAEYFFADGSSPTETVRLMLERGFVSALAVQEPTDFLARLGKNLHHVTKKLQQSQLQQNSQGRPRAKRNGHHSNLRQQILTQPLQNELRHLGLLVQRYQKRGLLESDVLEDAIALLDIGHSSYMSTVLAGLGARVATQPSITSLGKNWSLEQRSQLLNAARKAVNLLTQENSLFVLPGLASHLGQRFSQANHDSSDWPRIFYNTARKVASSPYLQQRLMDFEPVNHPQPLEINARESPLKVRINAPLEIVFRQS